MEENGVKAGKGSSLYNSDSSDGDQVQERSLLAVQQKLQEDAEKGQDGKTRVPRRVEKSTRFTNLSIQDALASPARAR